MSNHSSVEVFLGNPITIASEQQFLARLQRDLLDLGVSARILGNLQLGRGARQIDFVVVTDDRVVLVELKTFPGALVDAPKNGDWKVRVGGADVREIGNPARQAQETTFALSDELRAFAACTSAPGPSGSKFYRDIDTVVCAFPSLPDGSRVGEHPYVSILGYKDLLECLRRPGRRVPWSAADWDAFGQRLNLYRADEDSPEGMVRRAGVAAVDAYRGLYLRAQDDLPPLVETGVLVDGDPSPRPELAAALTEGQAVLLHGPSEFGKTLWARTAAVELARAGHVPIWLAASVCDPSFRTSLARAISPFTSLSPDELLRAADAAGCGVVLIIDDLTKAPEPVQQALVDGVSAVRLRNCTRALLITAQAAGAAGSIADALDVEVMAPTGSEREALLEAYGAPEIIDRCDGFVSPLELSVAAACAGSLVPGASAAELLDMHIDRLVDGDDVVRSGLRTVARLMHSSVMPSLARPDLVRTLRRDYDIGDTELQALSACPLLTVAPRPRLIPTRALRALPRPGVTAARHPRPAHGCAAAQHTPGRGSTGRRRRAGERRAPARRDPLGLREHRPHRRRDHRATGSARRARGGDRPDRCAQRRVRPDDGGRHHLRRRFAAHVQRSVDRAGNR
jgi:hypothetical protein